MDDVLKAPALSRRSLLKVGLMGSAFLAVGGVGATLSGCSAQPAGGFLVIRPQDLPILRGLLPAMLNGATTQQLMPESVEQTIKGLDYSLAHFSPAMLTLTQQLFDVLSVAVLRGPLTGIWGSWDNASAEDIKSFMTRWKNSPIALLRQGHASLLQLVGLAWYGQPNAWAHCGYPGPPKV